MMATWYKNVRSNGHVDSAIHKLATKKMVSEYTIMDQKYSIRKCYGILLIMVLIMVNDG